MGGGITKEAVLERLDMREFYSQYLELPNRNGTEVTVKCCFHEDTKPSLCLNLKSGFYKCQGCGETGDVFKMLQKQENLTFSEALKKLGARVGLTGGPYTTPDRKGGVLRQETTETTPIEHKLVDSFVDDLNKQPAMLNYLLNVRGLSADTIEAYRLGWCATRHRYSLPVYDDSGNVVNLRMYKPNVKDDEPKMESWARGYGKVRLYPEDNVTGDTVILCEGEFDCLMARQNGFNCYTHTGGANGFPAHLAHRFKDKTVYVLYDCDKPGEDGARHTAELLAPLAKRVYIPKLPLEEKGADINDFFKKHSRTAEELQAVLDAAPLYTNGKVRPGTKEFRALVPPSSYMEFYVHMGSELTDAPIEFHLATALATISTVLGNRVYFVAWGHRVYLNLWTLLIAPSGFFRKTTSMTMGLSLLRHVCPERIMPNDFTKERLIDTMSQPGCGSGIIPVYEFGSMLKSFGREYNFGLKELMTEFYDGYDYARETQAGGKKEVHDPAPSILAASTIDWLIGNAKTDDFKSGFFARFLFWAATEKNGWKGLDLNQEEHALVHTLESMLRDMQETEGQAVFGPKLIERYNEWLQAFESEVNDQKLPWELQGFYTRLGTYVLKFAVLYEIGTTYGLEVSLQSLNYAIQLADYLKSHVVRLFQDEVNATKEGREIRRVRQIIERAPGITRSELLKQSDLTARHLDEVLTTLVDSEQIQRTAERTGGRPKLTFFPKEST
jgi:5S rRNA maturation endonuclease (ribonuclease M5)